MDQSDDEMLIGYLECEFDLNQLEKKNFSKYRDLFARLDQNQDGFLMREEIKKPNLILFFDSDDDDQVTFEEGVLGIKKMKNKQRKQFDTVNALNEFLNFFC